MPDRPTQLPTVVNIRRKGGDADIYIGRPSKWGNPFVIGPDGDRETVIKKYEEWVRNKPRLMESLTELQGKTLGCFCAPLPCHGDVLVRLVAEQLSLDESFS